ncbi:hypothetical protein ACFFG9_03675, partial [Kutzneria buriramensis]
EQLAQANATTAAQAETIRQLTEQVESLTGQLTSTREQLGEVNRELGQKTGELSQLRQQVEEMGALRRRLESNLNQPRDTHLRPRRAQVRRVAGLRRPRPPQG